MGKGKVKAAQRKAASKTAGEMVGSDEEDDQTTNSTFEHDASTVGGETTASPIPSSSAAVKRVDVAEAMEWLVEKRATTRDKGLKALVAHFRSSLDHEEELHSIEDHIETILTYLLRLVRRPTSAKEGKTALELLCLTALYKGADEVELLETFEKPLKALIASSGSGDDAAASSSSGDQELRIAAVNCLALLSFICGGADSQDSTWMYFEEMIHGETTDASAEELPLWLRAAAVGAWVLLAAIHEDSEVLSRASGSSSSSDSEGAAASRFVFVSCSGNTVFEALQELLENPAAGTDVKISVSRCLAFLWEVAFAAMASSDSKDDDARAELLAASVEEAGRLLCYNPLKVNEVLSDIKSISKDSSKRISKKDKKEQRAELRDVEELLFTGAAPYQVIRVQGAVLELRSFAELRIYEALKDPLGSGFHSSLRLFPVLREVFGIKSLTSDMDGAGQDWKVAKNSSAQKRRTTDRKLERNYRAASAMFVSDCDC